MLRGTGQWQGNRTPDNQAANKLVDAGGIWFEDVGSTPTASIFSAKPWGGAAEWQMQIIVKEVNIN